MHNDFEAFMTPFPFISNPKPLDFNSEMEVKKILFHIEQNEENITRHPFFLEEYYTLIVKSGNVKVAVDLIEAEREYQDNTTFRLANSLDKHIEYCSVIRVYICCRAAISGGIAPIEAKDLSDLYMKKISLCNKKSEYNKLTQECFLIFTKLVNENKPKSLQFLHVKKCKNYIIRHLKQKITLPQLAKFVGINKNYLSTIFKQCENLTITEYISQLRINIAKYKLTYSNDSVTDIATNLNLGSPSRFAAKFKKHTNMTPLEYRKTYNHLSI